MPASLRSLAAVLAFSLGACLPPPLADCGDVSCGDPPLTTGGVASEPTTGPGGDAVQTATGQPTGTSTGDPTGTPPGSSGASTDDEVGPPTIDTVAVLPPTIKANGVVEVKVTTLHADAVRMVIDEPAGKERHLMSDGPDSFHDGIVVLSGSDNGEHTLTLTPSRDGVDGDEATTKYFVALPEPGDQVFWEAGDLVGAGSVAALGVLPDGLLVELGTFFVNDEPRCYLRRRQDGGSWFAEDFIEFLPDAHCEAIDMKIDPTLGTLHVLVRRKGGDGLRWWLGEIASWGKGVKNVGLGAVGDTAEAVAWKDGLVAVCGGRPVGNDLDAAAWLHRPNAPVETLLFDFKKDGFEPHRFAETARDCVLAGEVLVLVGEAFGAFTDVDPERRHRLLVEHDMATDFDTWTVAGPGPGTQSRALAVDVDDQGRYLVAGFTCGDICAADGELRIYKPGGELAWQAPLGPLNSEFAGPHDIAWHPAGYMVVALADFDGNALRFKVQAYEPDSFVPKWTFFPDDMQGLQIALALAIGQFGEVYAGGIGAGNFPAVAYIAG